MDENKASYKIKVHTYCGDNFRRLHLPPLALFISWWRQAGCFFCMVVSSLICAWARYDEDLSRFYFILSGARLNCSIMFVVWTLVVAG